MASACDRVSCPDLTRSAAAAIVWQRRITKREVARRIAPVADRKKASDDLFARVCRRARLARHALDDSFEVDRGDRHRAPLRTAREHRAAPPGSAVSLFVLPLDRFSRAGRARADVRKALVAWAFVGAG